jgi:hypothetical protein
MDNDRNKSTSIEIISSGLRSVPTHEAPRTAAGDYWSDATRGITDQGAIGKGQSKAALIRLISKSFLIGFPEEGKSPAAILFNAVRSFSVA